MKVRIWAALISVYIVWGATYLGMRFAVESIPPYLMGATRFTVAGLILFIWRKLAGDTLPTRIHWRSAAIIGLLMLVGGNGNVAWAEQYVASGVAALIIGSVPLWMVVIDMFWPGSPSPSWLTVSGVVIGFVGVALLVSPAFIAGTTSQTSAPGMDAVGIAVLILAAALWAVGSLYSRRAPLPESPLMGTAIEMLVGGLGLVVLGTASGEWAAFDLDLVSMKSLVGLLYLIIFGSLVGFAAYTWLLRVAPTPLVSTYAYVNPLVAIFLGSWLAHEPLTRGLLISTVVIVSAVALTTVSKGRRVIPKEQICKGLAEET